MNKQMQAYLDFTVKTFIVAFAVLLVSYALLMPVYRVFDRVDNVLNEVDNMLDSVDKTMVQINALADRFEVSMDEPLSDAKLRLFGMTSNPEVHYQIALIKEQRGDLAGAVREISLAVGLAAPDEEKYKAKLEELEARLSVSNESD